MSPVRRRHVVLRKMVSDEIRRRLLRGLIAVISRNAGILPLSRPVQCRPLWIHSLDLNTTDRKNPSDLDDDSIDIYETFLSMIICRSPTVKNNNWAHQMVRVTY